MARIKYVDDSYVEKVEHALYNNLSLQEYVYEDEFFIDKKVVKELLKPGEKYVILPDNWSHSILTSYGRLINMETMKQLSVRFTPNSLLCYLFSQRIPTEQIFLEQNWEFNIEKLKGYYDKYNWRHTKYP